VLAGGKEREEYEGTSGCVECARVCVECARVCVEYTRECVECTSSVWKSGLVTGKRL
jgi:hypothetical protein